MSERCVNLTHNQMVAGSIPARPTLKTKALRGVLCATLFLFA